MTLVIPIGFVQIQMHWSDPTFVRGHAVTTFACASVAADLVPLAEAVADAWQADIRGNQMVTCQLDDVTVLTALEAGVSPVGDNGSREGAQALPSTATLVSLRSALRGHKNTGRNYWPQMLLDTEVDDSGNIAGSTYADLVTGFNNFYATVGAEVGPPVILHLDGSAPAPVTSVTTQRKVATQRRRLR